MNLHLGPGSLAAAAVCALALTNVAGASAQADGTHHAVTRHSQIRTLSGASALSSTTTIPVRRFPGTDRIDTAIRASFDAWAPAGSTDGGLAQAVILSRSDQYADALGGASLAGAVGGPLLLTGSTTLDRRVKAEIDRVLGGKGTVYLLGGTGALSTGIEGALTHAGYSPARLGGADRFATSVRVAQEVGKLAPGGKPSFVFATTGLNFPDGLAAGATAGGYWASVVLTRDSTLTTPVKSYLDAMTTAGVEEYAVGGAAANVGRKWNAAYVGVDRFETAAMVAVDFWGDTSMPDDDPVGIGLATGLNWPDALAGGAYMAGSGPLVLSRTDSLPALTSQAVKALVASATPTSVQWGALFGGTAVVGGTVQSQFSTALNS